MKNEAIEMIKMPLSVVRVAAFCLPLALVAGCGSGESEALPGSTISISPTVWNQQTTAQDPACSIVKHYRVVAKSPSGSPQIGIQLLIDSPNAYLVYDGWLTPTNATCGQTIVGATARTVPYYATTDVSGGYDLTVVVGWTGGQNVTADAFGVLSGTAPYVKADIVFTCVDGDPVGTVPDCPI